MCATLSLLLYQLISLIFSSSSSHRVINSLVLLSSTSHQIVLYSGWVKPFTLVFLYLMDFKVVTTSVLSFERPCIASLPVLFEPRYQGVLRRIDGHKQLTGSRGNERASGRIYTETLSSTD
jgi:hypothetical protein